MRKRLNKLNSSSGTWGMKQKKFKGITIMTMGIMIMKMGAMIMTMGIMILTMGAMEITKLKPRQYQK